MTKIMIVFIMIIVNFWILHIYYTIYTGLLIEIAAYSSRSSAVYLRYLSFSR